MLVWELIGHLQKCNQHAKVLVYCFEDFNMANFVRTKKENQGKEGDEKEPLYCKGLDFSEHEEDDSSDYVVIGDRE